MKGTPSPLGLGQGLSRGHEGGKAGVQRPERAQVWPVASPASTLLLGPGEVTCVSFLIYTRGPRSAQQAHGVELEEVRLCFAKHQVSDKCKD